METNIYSQFLCVCNFLFQHTKIVEVPDKTMQCYYIIANHKMLCIYTRVRTLIVATIYLQLIQNRYMFRSFTVLQCSYQHCVQPVASDVEVVGYL